MANESNADIHRVYDYRYRNSSYFLQDQLRCSEAVQDFKSVRKLLSSAPSFQIPRVFEAALQPIFIQPDNA